jgi:hypothetical protein
VEQVVNEQLAGVLIEIIPGKTTRSSSFTQTLLGVRHPLSAASLRVAGKREQHQTLLGRRKLLDKLNHLVIRQGYTRHTGLL